MEPASRTKRPSKDSHKSCPLAGYYNNCSIMRTNKRQRETVTVQKKQSQGLHLVRRSRASVESNSLIYTMNLILVVSVLILTTVSVSTNETKLKGNSVLYKVGIFVLPF